MLERLAGWGSRGSHTATEDLPLDFHCRLVGGPLWGLDRDANRSLDPSKLALKQSPSPPQALQAFSRTGTNESFADLGESWKSCRKLLDVVSLQESKG